MYSTVSTNDPQRHFGQDNPRHYCPNRHSPIFTEDHSRCRDPRCSKQCHQAWAHKEHATVLRHLDRHLPSGSTVFRVHLNMPKDATVEDHARTREHVMGALRCLKSRLTRHRRKGGLPDVVLELRCYTHATTATRQHYDGLCVSTLSEDELRRHLRRLWTNAGGGTGRNDMSLVKLGDQLADVADAVGYECKVKARHRTRFHLPAANGLDFTFGTVFFTAKSKQELWQELRDEWFPKTDQGTQSGTPNTSICTPEELHELRNDTGTPLEKEVCVKAHHSHSCQNVTEDFFAVEEHERRRRDQIDIHHIKTVLGRTPADGLSLSQLAHRVGCPTEVVLRLLPQIPGIDRIPEWKDGTGKTWSSSGYFRNDYHATADQWRTLSDYCGAMHDYCGMDYRHMLRYVSQTEFLPS